MKVEEIIEKDKVREVREDFYNGIMKKMARNKVDDAGPVIRKRHLGMSIAAGIALGILVVLCYEFIAYILCPDVCMYIVALFAHNKLLKNRLWCNCVSNTHTR